MCYDARGSANASIPLVAALSGLSTALSALVVSHGTRERRVVVGGAERALALLALLAGCSRRTCSPVRRASAAATAVAMCAHANNASPVANSRASSVSVATQAIKVSGGARGLA